MLRQAIDKVIAWLFTKRDFQGARDFLSQLLLPFWPKYDFEKLPSSDVEQTPPGMTRAANGLHSWKLRKTDAALDINPGSGEAFLGGRRLVESSRISTDAEGAGPVDLLCHLFPIRVRREPALVLHCGASADLTSFVGELLPRFFALDKFDLPKDLLFLVSLRMGRQRFFQDALTDQIFRPRPIEIMRQFHLVSVNRLYSLQGPVLDPVQLSHAAERFRSIYGPYEPADRPIFLCSGGTRRAMALAKRYSADVPNVFGQDYALIDPARAALRDVVRAVASASSVAAPSTGEASILALAPSANRVLYELGDGRSAHPLADRLLDAIGEPRRKIPAHT